MVVSGFRRIKGQKKHGKCFFGERFAGVADRQAGPAVSFLRGETHGDDSARFAGVGGIGDQVVQHFRHMGAVTDETGVRGDLGLKREIRVQAPAVFQADVNQLRDPAGLRSQDNLSGILYGFLQKILQMGRRPEDNPGEGFVVFPIGSQDAVGAPFDLSQFIFQHVLREAGSFGDKPVFGVQIKGFFAQAGSHDPAPERIVQIKADQKRDHQQVALPEFKIFFQVKQLDDQRAEQSAPNRHQNQHGDQHFLVVGMGIVLMGELPHHDHG